MRVLVACEYSGVVRRAFRNRGHEAFSCDLIESDDMSPYHIKGDCMGIIGDSWDLVIAHPPCTDLAISGARHFRRKMEDGSQGRSVDFFMKIVRAVAGRKFAIENPIGIMSTRWRRPDQIIQPHQFGHPESKATCLWLGGLPLLKPTNDVLNEMMSLPKSKAHRIHYLPPGPNRWKMRSATYQGIAAAMADQWGNL